MTRARDIADQGAGTYGSITADDLTVDTTTLVVDETNDRVGIGTTSPSDSTLHVKNASGTALKVESNTGNNYINFYDGATRTALVGTADGSTNNFYVSNEANTPMLFRTNGTERMRIQSGGDFLIGCTALPNSGNGGAGFERAGFDRAILQLGTTTTTGIGVARFYNPNGAVGSIDTSGSSTAYNTSSDYRLKEDWVPMSDSIARVKALNPVNFAWKVDGTRVDGFLAHEAQEVVPEAVSGEKDAVTAYGNITDAEGNIVQENVVEPETLEEGQTWTKVEDRPDYQGIDQSKLVPLLTAALQEAIGRIETLEAEVTALKGA